MSNPTRERIKEAAFSLFAEKGYEATSIADIAAGVGVTKPALYVYFKGKEDLFLSIHEDIEEDYNFYMEQVFQETESMDIRQKLYHLFERYLVYFARSPDKNAFWYRVMLFPPQDLKDKLTLRVYRNEEKYTLRMNEIFQEGVAKGVIRPGSVEIMRGNYYSLREGQLFFAYFTLMTKKYDEKLFIERIKAIWEDYWLGIKNS